MDLFNEQMKDRSHKLCVLKYLFFLRGGKSSNDFSHLGRGERECQTHTESKPPRYYSCFSSRSFSYPLGSPQLRDLNLFLQCNSFLLALLSIRDTSNFQMEVLTLLLRQRCAMLRCCGCVWLPPIIFIGTHSLAVVETNSAKLFFYMERCVLWMCAMAPLRMFEYVVPLSIDGNGYTAQLLHFCSKAT
ncbi:hypothetical protein SFRURICE_011636 [Spodoptera frugiperda]|nr:hypothetical protein SFRURICE_011636 [Spodoptera frugiperda]